MTTAELETLLRDFLTFEAIVPFASALAILVLGLIAARVVASSVDRFGRDRLSLQHRMIFRRAAFYGIVALVVATALGQLGVDLSVLLGAAGILSVAVGFASQTSASNLISGLFLLGEQPFVLGDVITVEGTSGEVIAIDLLSVKLRTFDNLLVRLPNEMLLKAQIVNNTHFPIRRFDLKLRVGVDEDLGRVRGILQGLADETPICLDEPRPQVFLLGFSEMGMELQFSVWSTTSNYLELRFVIQQKVREALVDAGIEIPGPQRGIQGPVEVRLVDSRSEPPAPAEPADHHE